jgi:hypothetical protein
MLMTTSLMTSLRLHEHPPRRPPNQGGNPNHPNPQHVCNDDPFTKVKFSIPPFYDFYDVETYLDWEMTVEQKFNYHLVPEHIMLDKPLVSLKILLLYIGMNCLAFIYNLIHEIC